MKVSKEVLDSHSPIVPGRLMPEQNGTHNQLPILKPASSNICVVLADSKPIHLLGMDQTLALKEDIRVVANVGTLPDLYAALERYLVNVVVLEGELFAGSSYVIPELVRLSPKTKLIVHTTRIEPANTVNLYRSGVHGVVERSIAPELLVKCVRKVSDGETWIDNASIRTVIGAYRSHTPRKAEPQLSKKEVAIVRGVASAMRNKEIAYQIGTSEQVVKNSLCKIFKKLGVADRLELALYCLNNSVL